ncbi:uncharacterized protein LOC108141633 isoform X2 [Drosophila elegans]|uniref:uncharacterized protein LOC108141633 isoform X2 n=1 Tax=Drosophila elegans TaxID=30023 RepID=UPI001BC868C3|nr:uncharacterized protein LOC108141633 isoform X2 [Drosophila elegans]
MLAYRSLGNQCQFDQQRYRMPSPYQNKCIPFANFGNWPHSTILSYDSRAQAGSCQRVCWQNGSDTQEVTHDFSVRNPQQLSKVSPRNCDCKPSGNYNFGQSCPGQFTKEAPLQFAQQSRQIFPQLSPHQFIQQSPQQITHDARQQFLLESCQPFPEESCSQRSSRKCYFQLPPQNCCQLAPPNCFQLIPRICFQGICEDNGPSKCPKRCSFTITHEMGVQTDEMECEVTKVQSPKPEEPEILAVTELTTEELEVKHRTGKRDIIVKEIQSVTRFPNDGSDAVTEVETRNNIKQVSRSGKKLREETQKTKTSRGNSRKEDVITDRVIRQSELDPIVESFKAETGNKPDSSQEEQLIYEKYETFERDFNTPQHPPRSPISHSPLEDTSRSESGKDMFSPNEERSSVSSVDKIKKKKPKVPKVRKKRSSEYDNVSTLRLRVTKRKEQSVKRPNARESQKNVTSVYESTVTQMIVKKPKPKKSEPTNPEPEKKKPRKPEKKWPKPKHPPETGMKHGFPSNDLVCRYENPPKCRPNANTTSFRCPRPPSSCRSQCPMPPASTTQYDPIYGFGSHCVAYYRC